MPATALPRLLAACRHCSKQGPGPGPGRKAGLASLHAARRDSPGLGRRQPVILFFVRKDVDRRLLGQGLADSRTWIRWPVTLTRAGGRPDRRPATCPRRRPCCGPADDSGPGCALINAAGPRRRRPGNAAPGRRTTLTPAALRSPQ